MSEIINLNQARKARAKAQAKAQAAQNRIAHGRTKSDRQAAERERDRLATHLDGAKRED